MRDPSAFPTKWVVSPSGPSEGEVRRCTSRSRSSRSTVLRCEGGPLRVWKRFLIPKMRALYLFSPSDGSYWRRRSGFFVTVGPTSQRKAGVMTCFYFFIFHYFFFFI